IVPAPLLEDSDLVALGLRDDLRRDGEAFGVLQVAAVAGEHDIAQSHLVAGVARQLLDDDLVSRGDAILLAARAHDCEHWLFSSSRNPVRARAGARLGPARESEPPMAGGRGCQPRRGYPALVAARQQPFVNSMKEGTHGLPEWAFAHSFGGKAVIGSSA